MLLAPPFIAGASDLDEMAVRLRAAVDAAIATV